MEPVTAFGLAAGIVQVVDFSVRAVQHCREMYEHGSSAANVQTEEIAKHLGPYKRVMFTFAY